MMIFSDFTDNGDTITVNKLELLNLLSSELALFEQHLGEFKEAIECRKKLIQQLASTLVNKES
jgi:hypothetical protein